MMHWYNDDWTVEDNNWTLKEIEESNKASYGYKDYMFSYKNKNGEWKTKMVSKSDRVRLKSRNGFSCKIRCDQLCDGDTVVEVC